MSDTARTLLLALDASAARPSPSRPWLFMNAERIPDGDPDLVAGLACVQEDRRRVLDLRAAGYAAEPVLGEGPFAGALVLADKQKAASRLDVLRACQSVAPGAAVIVAGAKTLGIGSLRAWAARFTPVEGSLAKHHAVAFTMARPDNLSAMAADAVPPDVLVDGRYRTVPGAFSPEHVDHGSAMLAELFDESLTGNVADLGCGWGYLSVEAALRGRPASMTLVDAHWGALQAARANMAALAPAIAAKGEWLDLTREVLPRAFDAVVMNPPFHAGRKADLALGKAFVQAAGAALKPGGRLLMVANRKLPYEDTLAAMFRKVAIVVQRDGYKLIAATR